MEGWTLLGHGHVVPLDYHRGLLEDHLRVEAFERALRVLVRPGDVVLDFGSGSGVLGLLAARRGARVHAVEAAPIGGLAQAVAEANGLAGRLTLHRGDFLKMTPAEPVDLVVSEYLGRFVVDDGMMAGVAAAARWMKPGARFCPMLTRMFLAPVGNFPWAPIDFFDHSLVGLDFAEARPYTQNIIYHAAFGPNVLLGDAVLFQEHAPPDLGPALDRTLSMRVARGGTLRGLLGWFDTWLADDVLLTTEPGLETHWGQVLFPINPVHVKEGDILDLRLWRHTEEPLRYWRWEGSVRRDNHEIASFAHEAYQRLGERTPQGKAQAPTGRAAALAAAERGSACFNAEDWAGAVQAAEEATAALTPDEDDLAPDLYEALGVSLLRLGKHSSAIPALLRALDGGVPVGHNATPPAEPPRRGALRFLINAWVGLGRQNEARFYLDAYERHFGPHPDLSRRKG